jgi:hypothetical protein
VKSYRSGFKHTKLTRMMEESQIQIARKRKGKQEKKVKKKDR